MKAEIIDSKLVIFPESNTEKYAMEQYNLKAPTPIDIDCELLLELDT